MKTLLQYFYIIFLFFGFSGISNAQCSITGTSVNASFYSSNPCTILSSCNGVIYIGNGTAPTTLLMDNNLDLSCMGAIRFVVRNNATLDFSNGNYDLQLAAGSSIEIEAGGHIGSPSNCSAADLIKIGNEKIASCTGTGGGVAMSFSDLVAVGGYSSINVAASPSSLCGSGSATLIATANPSIGATYKWYTVSSGGAAVFTGNSFTISNISSTTAYYVEATYSSPTYTTIRKPITVTVNALPAISAQPINQLDCEGASVNFTVIASGTGLTYLWQFEKPGEASFTNITSTTSNVRNFDKNIITIDNAGSTQFPDGTKFQVVISNGICSVISSVAILSVNKIMGISPISTNVTQCYGTNYSYTVSTSYPANVVSYQWKSSVASGSWNNVVDGAHFSGATTATLNIINGTPSESAGYRVYITFHSSGADCNVSSTSRTRSITFLPLLLTPVTTVAQPSCTTATGTITVVVQSASDTYSYDNGGSYQASNVKSGLAAGNYNVIIKNAAGCVSNVKSVTINPFLLVDNEYKNGLWSLGTPPTKDGVNKLVFNSIFTSTDDLSGCSCQVNAQVTINHTLTLADELKVGSVDMVFKNGASLVQTNNVVNVNTGVIKYQRKSLSRNTDYTYWSSPVSDQTLYDLSPSSLAGTSYSYGQTDTTEDWVKVPGSTIMDAGKGYIIRGREGTQTPPNTNDVEFYGIPNNGHYELSGIFAGKSYLLGNPYPSAINADAFLTANSSVLDGTLYFWTHNTAIQDRDNITDGTAGIGAYAYTSNDYATYNKTGGTAAAPSDTSGNSNSIPNGYIAAGQGFFASSKVTLTDSKIVFDNNMRVASTVLADGTGANQQFFKTRLPKTETVKSIEKNRIWLNLTNAQGAFKQTLVGYITNATNDYDSGFDGESFDGNDFVDFYSINQNKKLTIQGRALPFDTNDEVPLGFKTKIDGAFTINLEQVDGFLTSQDLFLEDKLTNAIVDLKMANYTFNTLAGTFDDRFVLRYTNKTLGTNDFKTTTSKVLVSCKNKQIKINSFDGAIHKLVIYDLLGRPLFQKNKVNSNELVVPNLNFSQQTLVIKATLENGATTTHKIIFQ